jgi:hypothetical protein
MAGDGVLDRHVNALGLGCEHASFREGRVGVAAPL